MKYLFSVLLFFIFLFINKTFGSQTHRVVFYVSVSGNDDWSGKIPEKNTEGTDGPFRSLEKAKGQITQLVQQNIVPEDGIDIIIRGGTYTLGETLELTNMHSKITWKNYPGETVQLIGGKPITGFHTVTDAATLNRIDPAYRNNILEIDLKAIGITDYGKIANRGKPGAELFFDNKKMPLSRWPNEGWAIIADVPQTGILVNPGELPHMRFGMPVGRHYGKFTYTEDRPGKWADINNIILHGYWTWNWFDEFLGIQSIDSATKTIFIKPPHSQYGLAKEQRYYAMNILEELDEPGEWFLDRTKGLLFFWPPAPLKESTVFMSLLDQPLIVLNKVENVHIEGLTLAFSRGDGINVIEGKNNTVSGCSFNNLGGVPVLIAGGQKNGVTSCDIHDVAGGGIVLSGGNRKTLMPGGNFAVNNHVYNIGQWLRTYQAAIKIDGVGNYIAHNLIHNGPGAGILLTGNEHIIEYNELHDLALETGDVGGFYMGRDWTERGNIIRYNYFHDLTGPGAHDVNAVYLDDWASGTTVYGNIFSNCARGIMIGGGRDNLVDNNLFTDCGIAIHADSRGLGWASYYFDGKDKTLFNRMDAMNFKQPPYAEKYPILLSLYNDEPAVAKNNSIVHNIAWKGAWLDLHDGLDLKILHVQDNVLADVTKTHENAKDIIVKKNPGIYNLKKKDFRIKPKAMEHGFKAIPYNDIGLQQDSFRLKPVKTFSYK